MEADRADVEHKYEQEVRREGDGGEHAALLFVTKKCIAGGGSGDDCRCWRQWRIGCGGKKLLLDGLLQNQNVGPEGEVGYFEPRR